MVRVRFLHDGHDFSSGNLASAQADGAVLIGVNLATDGGDRHCNLDLLQDGKVHASDLRVRVHLSSVPDLVDLPSFSAGQSVVMPFGKVTLMARVEEAAFDSFEPVFEITRDGEDVYLDVVLYGGPDRLIDLTAVNSAYVVMVLALWDETEAPPAPDSISVTRDADRLTAEWTPYPQPTLAVRLSSRPVPYRQLRQTALGLNK